MNDEAVIAAGVRALGWGDAVSHLQVLTRDVVWTTGLVRDGRRFIMKQFPADTCLALLRERIAVLGQLARVGQAVPRMVTTEPVGFTGAGHAGWLIVSEYLPGEALTRLSLEDFEDLGARVGELHVQLRAVEIGPNWAIHSSCSLRACTPSPRYFPPRAQLLHGDLHMGNVIRTGAGYAFIDFDEMALGRQIDDVAALLGIPMLRRHPNQSRAILRGYTRTLNDPVEADRVYGPELVLALARRFRHLAAIQRPASSGPGLIALADELDEHASGSRAGLDGWLSGEGK
jgi:Ser/Thr protein kinase RdoA (MazF antagonist)